MALVEIKREQTLVTSIHCPNVFAAPSVSFTAAVHGSYTGRKTQKEKKKVKRTSVQILLFFIYNVEIIEKIAKNIIIFFMLEYSSYHFVPLYPA